MYVWWWANCVHVLPPSSLLYRRLLVFTPKNNGYFLCYVYFSSNKTNSSNHCHCSGLKTEDSKEDLVNHLGPGNHTLTNNHSSDQSEPAFSDEEGEGGHKHGDDEDDDDIPLGEWELSLGSDCLITRRTRSWVFTESYLDLLQYAIWV